MHLAVLILLSCCIRVSASYLRISNVIACCLVRVLSTIFLLFELRKLSRKFIQQGLVWLIKLGRLSLWLN